jgi:hypothetical protein
VVSSIEPVENYGSSASYVVSGDITYGAGSLVQPPLPPTPSTPSTPSGGSSSGGGHKYDASNWILERKYNELASARGNLPDEGDYTSAPKDREHLSPFPVEETVPALEKEISGPDNEVLPKEKLQTNVFKPKEEAVSIDSGTNIFEAQSFDELQESTLEGEALTLPGSLFVSLDLATDERMFPLALVEQPVRSVSQECSVFHTASPKCDCRNGVGSFILWLWILLFLIFVNLCLLFWQLLIVKRLILDDQKKENTFQRVLKKLLDQLKKLKR